MLYVSAYRSFFVIFICNLACISLFFSISIVPAVPCTHPNSSTIPTYIPTHLTHPTHLIARTANNQGKQANQTNQAAIIDNNAMESLSNAIGEGNAPCSPMQCDSSQCVISLWA